LGGAYAVSRELLVRMRSAHYLDNPSLWLPVDCPEDVMVGIYTRAVGLGFRSFVGDGEVFGVRHRGLPDTPPRLIERSFSVIHSITPTTLSHRASSTTGMIAAPATTNRYPIGMTSTSSPMRTKRTALRISSISSQKVSRCSRVTSLMARARPGFPMSKPQTTM